MVPLDRRRTRRLLVSALPLAAVQILLFHLLRDQFLLRLVPESPIGRGVGVGLSIMFSEYMLLLCLVAFHLFRIIDKLRWTIVGMGLLAGTLALMQRGSVLGRTHFLIGVAALAIPYLVELLAGSIHCAMRRRPAGTDGD